MLNTTDCTLLYLYKNKNIRILYLTIIRMTKTSHQLCAPRYTSNLLFSLLCTQCAAVNTHVGEINVPPQWNLESYKIPTCQGHEFGFASRPPTTRAGSTELDAHSLSARNGT